MNRFAVLLAALSTLSVGCVSSSNNNCATRTVALGWPSFLLANGATTSACSAAGVANVNVFMDNGATPFATIACTDGGVNITGVLNDANHTFTVEGLDGSGAILLRDAVTVSPSDCQDLLVNTRPSEGTFTLDYHFTPTDVCAAGSVIWFAIRDNISGDLIAIDESHSPATYACSSVISFALASGGYTLQRTEEAVRSGSSWRATGANCNSTNFDMVGGQQSVVQVSMANTTAFCP